MKPCPQQALTTPGKSARQGKARQGKARQGKARIMAFARRTLQFCSNNAQ